MANQERGSVLIHLVAAVLLGCCAVLLHGIHEDVHLIRLQVYGKTVDERVRSLQSQIEEVP